MEILHKEVLELLIESMVYGATFIGIVFFLLLIIGVIKLFTIEDSDDESQDAE